MRKFFLLFLLIYGLHSYSQTVTEIEYFFDNDPGYGNGISVLATTPDSEIEENLAIVTGTLSKGFHTLYFRAYATDVIVGDSINGTTIVYDTLDTWGMTESRLVFVDESDVLLVELDSIEVFFDHDPGYGQGFIFDGFAISSEVQLQELIPTDTLSLGFHTLFIRVKAVGGRWGIPEQRLIFVDQSGVISDISDVEVFIDHDPGYGNGVSLGSFTANPEVTFSDIIPTDTLSIGFHTIFIRTRTPEGTWGIPEQRLIFVDQTGAGLANVDELEYFIDVDPGYGLATSIPIGTPSFEVFREFAMATDTLSAGTHSLTVRAKDENGTWGIPESFGFQVYNDGRELDSASLVTLYNNLNGSSWTNQSNWLSDVIDNWYGITVVNGRVDSVDLKANNLAGQIPFQAGYISQLKKLDLSENNLQDTVPDQIADLSQLEELFLHDNKLNQLPDLSGIASLTTVSLDSNFFDFGDLEPLAGVADFTYSNQQIPGEEDSDSIVRIGQQISIEGIEVEGVNNVYQWFLNGDTIPSQDLKDLVIDNFSPSDTGVYQLKIQNTIITDLVLVSAKYRAILSNFDKDSLALVSLYNSTDGPNWSNNTGWLSNDLSGWNGVTLQNNRVTDLTLPGNGLNGAIPEDFTYADSLILLDLSDNVLTDEVPASFSDYKYIQSIDLSDNEIEAIPSFNTVATLQTLDVSGNRLQFGDLEVNLGIPTFIYNPMDSITMAADTLVDSESNVTLSLDVTGSNNNYQWYKDDQALPGDTESSLLISNVQFADEGKYRLEITNSLVTGLTLTSGEILLKVSSLSRDSAALRAFYDATGGGDIWTATVNWLSAPVTSWDSVLVVNERVTEVSLQNSGISGSVPTDIRDITSLRILDLSENDIESIPNMSQMGLTFFDMRNNKLHFDDIEPNISIQGFEINPQDSLSRMDFEPLETIQQGTSLDSSFLNFKVGGINNEYQWFLQKRDSTDAKSIPGANEDTYVIDSINFEDMGYYYLSVTSPVVSAEFPGFELISKRQYILATANISGVVLGENNQPLSSGIMDALKTKAGAYDSLEDKIDVINGEFLVPNLILGNYVCVTLTDGEVYIPTYVGNTEDWAQAETIELREDLNVNDVFGDYIMILRPAEPTDGEAKFSMLVESDFQEEGDDGGRIEARRKVRKAGCSLRRRIGSGGGGRVDQDDEFELIAYKETDDNGEVSFGQLPVGVYRINIQYPGIPLDPESFTQFEIKEGEERSDISVNALVTETGITIELVNFITAYQRYFRNLKVYPNPAEDHFMISYDRLLSDQVRVKLTDMQGRLVRDIPVEKGYGLEKKIDVDGLDKGVYFLYFYDPEFDNKPLSVFKVIITK